VAARLATVGISGTVKETTVSAAGVLEPRMRLARQRCSSIEITIRDALRDAYGLDVVLPTAGMKLNELVFELGLVTSFLGRDIGGSGGAAQGQ
jgi:hypothetical protein